MRYYILTVPGIEPITRRELEGSFKGARRFDAAPGRLIFDYPHNPTDLLPLGTAEDVFALIADGAIDSSRRGLRQAHALVRKSPLLRQALKAHRRVAGRPPRRRTFRVVAQRNAGETAYRRIDLQQEVSKALASALPAWRIVDENAQCEFWVLQDRGKFLCGMRLSDRSMRHRDYKKVNVPASLRPVVARAMVMISDPHPRDVFLDPMCGAGTIPIERGRDSPYRHLLVGDVDRAAIAATRANVGPRYKPISIMRWDARRLPLPARSVHKIVCNLPFGRKSCGFDEPNLYSTFLDESSRTLKRDGIAVLLTSRERLLSRLLGARAQLSLESMYRIRVLGRRATIFKIRRNRA
ncbi:MAG: methyltransferase [Chloroflexi bacterium]|nr:methyltransferase [Chloroflexota bacterium]MCY3938179.1 methyltransferase [Chloroflexota bacterium]